MITELQRALRRVVPLPVRRLVALVRRRGHDWLDGNQKRLARSMLLPLDWPRVVTIAQPIKQSHLWQGKLANLQRGVAALDGVKIAPGELFSFWHWLGRPSAARGFAPGRAIRDDVETGDAGGGLCQLSGIAYELGLRAGLSVAERHAHSRDLYADEAERFTPLGLDATVVWPWKDLRLENQLDVPVMLRFGVEGLILTAWLEAEVALPVQPLALEREDHADHRAVIVRVAGKEISRDRYAI